MTSSYEYAFYNCSGLTGPFELPASLHTLGRFAFGNCTGLTGTLIIPGGLTTLENSVFSRTNVTGAVTIPDSVEVVDNYAFSSCTGISSVTFGTGLKSLGTAFYNCTGVTELTFTGTTVPTLNGNPFSGLTNLETIYIPAESSDNWLRDKENMFIIGIPAGTSYEEALDHYARLGLEALITDASGNPTTSVGTGSLVDLGGEVYEAVVLGDVDGDASVSQNDLDLMLDHINYQQMLDGAYLRAAQATNEEEVGIFDLYEVFDYTETHTLED